MRGVRVSVFAPVGTLDHQTGILNAVHCFASAGFEVDVFTIRNRHHQAPVFESSAVRLCFLPWTFDSEREPRTVVTLLFIAWILCTFWRSHPVIFAGGIRGLVAAYAYSLLRRTRIINYQTELYVGSKLDTRAAALFKALERRAAQRSVVTIEHTEERRSLLAEDLGVPVERIVIVPNAPVGLARRINSTFLHLRLGLSGSKRILLCPGTIGDEFEAPTVVKAAQALPPEWVCVLHSAQRRSADEPYLKRLRDMDRGSRVAWSLEPIPYGQIDELMGSARIGMALYSATVGENYSTVGLASGKLSHFLRVGVPVIVSPLPGLADFVVDHGIGEVLEDPHRLNEIIARIEANWHEYHARALRCFDAFLSYDQAFKPIITLIDQSEGRRV